MREIKLVINTGYVNCTHEEIIEVEDDTTDKEINQILREFLHENIDEYWEEIEGEK